MKTYYEILGVARNASQDDIKKSYHTLAMRLHPDKNKHEGAKEAFQALGAAYEVLSEPTRRGLYNLTLDSDPDAAASPSYSARSGQGNDESSDTNSEGDSYEDASSKAATPDLEQLAFEIWLSKEKLTFKAAQKIVTEGPSRETSLERQHYHYIVAEFIVNHLRCEKNQDGVEAGFAIKSQNARMLLWAALFKDVNADLLNPGNCTKTMSMDLYPEFKTLPENVQKTIIRNLLKVKYFERCARNITGLKNNSPGAQGFLLHHFENDNEQMARFFVEAYFYNQEGGHVRYLKDIYPDHALTPELFKAIFEICCQKIQFLIPVIKDHIDKWSYIDTWPMPSDYEKCIKYFFDRLNPSKDIREENNSSQPEFHYLNFLFLQKLVCDHCSSFDLPSTKTIARLILTFTPKLNEYISGEEKLALYLLLKPYMLDNRIFGFESKLATYFRPFYIKLENDVLKGKLFEIYNSVASEKTRILSNLYFTSKENSSATDANLILNDAVKIGL